MKPISYILSCFKSSPNTLAANATKDENDQTISNLKFHVFSYSELETATQGFKNKIGEGGCDSVYKGRLIGDNFVAVKVLSVELDSMRGEREFLTEIAALSDIRHENLVTLRGCCVDGAQRLLVYNYMENNSLLHSFLESEVKRVKFTWNLRKHVSLGIVKGICYLHEELHPHIVHRDIKAWELYNDKNLLKLVDSALNGNFPKTEAVRFLKVGLLCVQEIARLRPSMSTVIKMLNNEIETDNVEISRPGLIADLKNIKTHQKQSFTFQA